MTGFLRFFFLVAILFLIFLTCAFPMGAKNEKIPLKPYPVIDIPDGEFLHYGNYSHSEKYGDTYMVIKKEANESGDFNYRIYKDDIRISGGKKLPENYKDWQSSFLIDPKRGSVLEASENLGYDREGDSGTANYNYRLYPEKGYVDFVSKTIKNKVLSESKYRVKVNPDFPAWDNFSMYYAPCFLDNRSGGIMYLINPAFFKEPLPVSFKHLSADTIRTKAGTFRTSKAVIIFADAFISKLMEPLLKGTAMWVEDSDRRILIKAEMAGYVAFIEEISNVR